MSHDEETLTKIANEVLKIETLNSKSSLEENFHELSVWGIKVALEKAFAAGIEQGWQNCVTHLVKFREQQPRYNEL